MGGDDLVVLPVRPGICYGACRNVGLLYYRDSPTVSDLKQREPLLRDVAERYPEGCAFVSVIETSYGAALPDAKARAETSRQVRAHQDALVAGAMVLVGDSLKTSLVRSLLRGLLLLRRDEVRLSFFSTIEEGCEWTLAALGLEGSELKTRENELMKAIEAMGKQAGYPE